MAEPGPVESDGGNEPPDNQSTLSVAGSSDAPVCENYPCPSNNPAVLACYHVECTKQVQRQYRFFCLTCDTKQHEDAPYHVRTTVSQFQTAIAFSSPSTLEEPRRKKFTMRKMPENPDVKKASVIVNCPTGIQRMIKLDGSLLRTAIQTICAQQKLNMEYLDVMYAGNGEHVDVDNYVLGFQGQTLAIRDRTDGVKSPKGIKKIEARASSSRLGIGAFKWRRESKSSGSSPKGHERAERSLSGGTSTPESRSISGARSLTDLVFDRDPLSGLGDIAPPVRTSSASPTGNGPSQPPPLPPRGNAQCPPATSVELNLIPPTPQQQHRPKSDNFSFPSRPHKRSPPASGRGSGYSPHSPARRCTSWAPDTYGFHVWDDASLPGFAKEQPQLQAANHLQRTPSPLTKKHSPNFGKLDLKRLLSGPAALARSFASQSSQSLNSSGGEMREACTLPPSYKYPTSRSTDALDAYDESYIKTGESLDTDVLDVRRMSTSPKASKHVPLRRYMAEVCSSDSSRSPSPRPLRYGGTLPPGAKIRTSTQDTGHSPVRRSSPAGDVAQDSPRKRTKSDVAAFGVDKRPHIGDMKKAQFLSLGVNNVRRESYAMMRSVSDQNLNPLHDDARRREETDGPRVLARHRPSPTSEFPPNDPMLNQARTNKKLAKLLGAENSNIDRRQSGSELEAALVSSKSSKIHQRSLAEQLEMFSVYGISPDATKTMTTDTRSDFWLPSTWTGLTDNVKALSKRNIDEQEAIWELLTTAVTHAERLWTLNNVFRASLVILQEKGFLTQVKIDRLYLNIADLKELDETFWRDQMSNIFKEAKHKGHLLKASMIAECFEGFSERFTPYIDFCGNQMRISKYLAVLKKEDSDFMSYLNWCESHPTCNRLQLTDMLAAPFQRLTKFPLLIKAIMKKTHDDSAKEALQGHLSVVERFLGKVNHHVAVCQKRALLQAVADRLDENYVEVPVEFEQYVVAGLNLQDRMWTTDGLDIGERELLHEETFKLREFAGKYAQELKVDVVIFLFSDMILITKQRAGGRLQLVKPPLMIYTISLSRAKDNANNLYIVQIHAVGMAAGFLVLQGATAQAASSFAKHVSEAQFSYRSLVMKGHKNSGKAGKTNRTFSKRLARIPGSIYKPKQRRSSKPGDIRLQLDVSSEDVSEADFHRTNSDPAGTTSGEAQDDTDSTETGVSEGPLLDIDEDEVGCVSHSMSCGNVLDEGRVNRTPAINKCESFDDVVDSMNCQLTISFVDEENKENPYGGEESLT